MENIYEPNASFDFSKLSFISPTSIVGGNYFIRCLSAKQTPLYIQAPKCTSKQGIVKAGKKMYCDLLFSHEDEAFIEFIGALETFCQGKLFENREKWFESGLELHDIENSFTPSLKIFKTGKLYSVRSQIPVRLGKSSLKIFNEHEQDVLPENVGENVSFVSILEVQGIKCSARNFQLEIEMKQMMILNPVDIFEKCIFYKTKPKVREVEEEAIEEVEEAKEEVEEAKEETKEEAKEEVEEAKEKEAIEAKEVKEAIEAKEEKESKEEKELEEIEFMDLEPEIEPVKLKKRNDVYYEMYSEAKRKAKIAHDFAITSYLEAKRIKNTYMLHDVDDEEIDKEEEGLREIRKELE